MGTGHVMLVECPDCGKLIPQDELKEVAGEIGLLVCVLCVQNYGDSVPCDGWCEPMCAWCNHQADIAARNNCG